MSEPSFLYQAWTYHPLINFCITLWLDVGARMRELVCIRSVIPVWWTRSFEDHVKTRREFREEAKRICERHELIKYCSICDEDDF